MDLITSLEDERLDVVEAWSLACHPSMGLYLDSLRGGPKEYHKFIAKALSAEPGLSPRYRKEGGK